LEKKRDRRFLYFIIFAIVIVAGAVVGILFGLNIVGGGGGSNNDESSAEQPDNNATPAPSLVVLWVPPNPVPDNPPGSYFNYDENDDKYGPSAWKKVNTQNHPLREFSRFVQEKTISICCMCMDNEFPLSYCPLQQWLGSLGWTLGG
jgi:hypothetical protein